MRRTLAVMLSIALLCVLFGCQGEQISPQLTSVPPQATPGVEPSVDAEATAEQEDLSTPTNTPDGQGAIAATLSAVSGLSVQMLFQAMDEAGGNAVLSPQSMLSALGLLYAGMAGDAKAQLQSALALPDVLGADWLSQITKLNAAQGAVTIKAPLGVFMTDRASFAPALKSDIAPAFGAYLTNMVFGADAAAAMNVWLSEETAGKYDAPVSATTASSLLYLLAAFEANAAWDLPLKAGAQMDFATGAKTVKADALTLSADLHYSEGENYEAVKLPLGNGAYSLAIFMPKEGNFAALRQQMLGEQGLAKMLASAQYAPKNIALTMPSFKATAAYDMRNLLLDAGLGALFTITPEGFAAMLEGDAPLPMAVSQYIACASISLGEGGLGNAPKGQEQVSPQGDLHALKLSGRFVYALVDESTQSLLYLGVVEDPTA